MLWRNGTRDSLGGDPANRALDVLRDRNSAGPLPHRIDFAPGFRFNADRRSAFSGRWISPEGRLLELDVAVETPGDWIALHLAVPARRLDDHDAFGFVLRGAAPDFRMIRACLRSGTGLGLGFVDCFFDKHILLQPEAAQHVDAVPLRFRNDLPLVAPWRELVLFLPTDSFRLSLHDLRLFLT